jgi:DNA-binding MarR family transcriptional regulator
MKNEDLNTETSVEDIDRIIHEPARLNVMLYLYVVEKADFTFLLHKTGLSKGNLSVQIQKLEQSGYVEVEKEFVNRKPHTILRLTKPGRKAFEQYKEMLIDILQKT